MAVFLAVGLWKFSQKWVLITQEGVFWGGTSLICISPLINSGEAARLNLALLRGGEAGP